VVCQNNRTSRLVRSLVLCNFYFSAPFVTSRSSQQPFLGSTQFNPRVWLPILLADVVAYFEFHRAFDRIAGLPADGAHFAQRSGAATKGQKFVNRRDAMDAEKAPPPTASALQ